MELVEVINNSSLCEVNQHVQLWCRLKKTTDNLNFQLISHINCRDLMLTISLAIHVSRKSIKAHRKMNEFMIMNFLSQDKWSFQVEFYWLSAGVDIVDVENFRNIKSNNIEMSWKQRRKVFLQDVSCEQVSSLECVSLKARMLWVRECWHGAIEDTAQMRKNTRKTMRGLKRENEKKIRWTFRNLKFHWENPLWSRGNVNSWIFLAYLILWISAHPHRQTKRKFPIPMISFFPHPFSTRLLDFLFVFFSSYSICPISRSTWKSHKIFSHFLAHSVPHTRAESSFSLSIFRKFPQPRAFDSASSMQHGKKKLEWKLFSSVSRFTSISP